MDYDINPLKVKVQYTFAEYKEYFIFSFFRGKRYHLGKWLFFIIYPVLIAIATALVIFSEFDSAIILCDFILILIFAFIIFIINYSPRKNYKNYEKLFSSGIFFEFRNNDFSVNQSNNLFTGEGTIKYEALFKVYETKTMFYIFIAPNQAYLINKNSIADPNSLRQVLQNKVDKKKFIKCFKEK